MIRLVRWTRLGVFGALLVAVGSGPTPVARNRTTADGPAPGELVRGHRDVPPAAPNAPPPEATVTVAPTPRRLHPMAQSWEGDLERRAEDLKARMFNALSRGDWAGAAAAAAAVEVVHAAGHGPAHPETVGFAQGARDFLRAAAYGPVEQKELTRVLFDLSAADSVRNADPEQAVRLRLRALAVLAVLNPGSALEAAGYRQLADDYLRANRRDAALAAALGAGKRYAQVVGAEHPAGAEARFLAADLLYQLGRYEEAEQALQASLLSAALACRNGDPVLVRRWEAYLLVVSRLTRPARERALADWQQVLARLTAEFGPELENLPYLYLVAGALAKRADAPRTAKVCFEAAIDRLRPAPGVGVWLAAHAHDQLGGALTDLGHFGRAAGAHRAALDLFTGAGPADRHQHHQLLTALVRQNLGVALSAGGDTGSARGHLVLALDGLTSAPNPDPGQVALALYNLGLNAWSAGQLDEADEAVDAARRRLAGLAAPDVWWRLHSLRGLTLAARGRYAEAEQEHRAALRLLGEGRAGDSAAAVSEHGHLAMSLLNQLRIPAGLAEAGRGLGTALRLGGVSPAVVGSAHYHRAVALARSGEVAEAAGEAEAAFRSHREAYGDDHAVVVMDGMLLADLMHRLGRTRDALRLFRSLEPAARRVARSPLALGGWLRYHAELLSTLEEPGWEAAFEEALALHRRAGNPHALALARQSFAFHLVRWAQSPALLARPAERVRVLDRCAGEAAAVVGWEPVNTAPHARQVRFAARYVRAWCHLVSGESPEAEACLRPVTEALAANDPAVQGWSQFVRYTAGVARLLSGDLEAAEAEFRRAADDADARVPGFGPAALGRPGPAEVAAATTCLAAVLAKQGKPREASRALERGLARNLTDLLRERLPAAAGGADIGAIQSRLPPDAALVAWVDAPAWVVTRPGLRPGGAAGLRFACVLRRDGDPVWVELPGTGPGVAWTDADAGHGRAYAEALARRPTHPRGSREALNELGGAVAKLRVTPLLPHLGATDRLPAVRQLVAVLAGPLAETPVGTLTDDFAVWYCHSGTALSLAPVAPPPAGPPTALAFGDPRYGPAAPAAHDPPADGVLLLAVPPAARAAGVAPGDVVRTYDGVAVSSPASFDAALDRAARAGVPACRLTVWRAGADYTFTTPRWEAGVLISHKPAREAAAEFRRREVSLFRAAPDPPGPLSMCGPELAAVRTIYAAGGAGRVRVWTGADATPGRVAAERTAPDGWLGKADVLVFACHGRRDDTHPLATALQLAPDPGGGTTGELAAADTTGWKLRARVVVLSGCWTGAGTKNSADGPLGFAQAVLAEGAGACVVGLWEVDDQAAALLMTRFHLNLSGGRPGLGAPLPPHRALHEAQSWLRSLGVYEVARLADALRAGRVEEFGRPVTPAAGRRNEARPYDDPRYWSAFILIGSPD